MGWSNNRNSMGIIRRFWDHPVVTWWCSRDKYRNSNVTWWRILFGQFDHSRPWAPIIFIETGWNSNWSDSKYNERYESTNRFWRIRNIFKNNHFRVKWVGDLFSFLKLQWDASFRWSFGPNYSWDSIKTTIGKTHSTLLQRAGNIFLRFLFNLRPKLGISRTINFLVKYQIY